MGSIRKKIHRELKFFRFFLLDKNYDKKMMNFALTVQLLGLIYACVINSKGLAIFEVCLTIWTLISHYFIYKECKRIEFEELFLKNILDKLNDEDI